MRTFSRLLFVAAIVGFTACAEKDQKSIMAPTAATPAAPAQATATTAALNPAHGQPNHRCDIPVGAPLSAPAQPRLNAPVVAPPPAANSPAAQAVTAAGTNPPHGYPGHDCSKPVGAAL